MRVKYNLLHRIQNQAYQHVGYPKREEKKKGTGVRYSVLRYIMERGIDCGRFDVVWFDSSYLRHHPILRTMNTSQQRHLTYFRHGYRAVRYDSIRSLI